MSLRKLCLSLKVRFVARLNSGLLVLFESQSDEESQLRTSARPFYLGHHVVEADSPARELR
jgi:hypothetical protein